MSIDDATATFVANDIPPFGYAQFAVAPIKKGPPQENTGKPTLENGFYRITAKPEAGGLSSWFDKRLDRELLDTKADYLCNQPIRERSLRRTRRHFEEGTDALRTYDAGGRTPDWDVDRTGL